MLLSNIPGSHLGLLQRRTAAGACISTVMFLPLIYKSFVQGQIVIFFFLEKSLSVLVGCSPGIQEAMGFIPSKPWVPSPASHMPSMMNTCDQECNFILSYR